MSVYDAVRRHHVDLSVLFDRCLGLVDDPPARRRAFEALRDAMLAHGHAEEIVLYARLQQGALAGAAVDARREHQRQGELLARLDRFAPEDPDFQYELVALHRAFQRHVDEEERELLPLAAEEIGADEDDSLGQEWWRIERRAEAD